MKSYTIKSFSGLVNSNPDFLRKLEYKGFLSPSGRLGKRRTRVYSETLIDYAKELIKLDKVYGDNKQVMCKCVKDLKIKYHITN